MAWIARLPCVACFLRGRVTYGVHVAHIRAGYPADGWRPTGAAEKPSDRRCAPLCPSHHLYGPQAQHATGERAFWDRLGVHPPTMCAALQRAFAAGETGVRALASVRGEQGDHSEGGQQAGDERERG